MVLAAFDALALTDNTITKSNASDVQTEVSLAENRIRGAAGLGLFSTSYNATIIGNPQTDPRNTPDLAPNQQDFFNLFVNAGYVVTVDSATGFWLFIWSGDGPDNLVQIYSFRTSLDPSTISAQTISAITGYFDALRPIVHTTVSYNGFIDEAGFGGVTSTFFEFTIVVDQQNLTDNSAGLKTFVIGQGLGYMSGNCNVYRLVA